MAASTGKEFIQRLNSRHAVVQIDGETVTDRLAEHPAFAGVAKTFAELYDMQHDPKYRDTLTYESPSSGARVATSFMVPTTQAELIKRREAASIWAKYSFGMLGRTGDYLNSALMALSTAGDWFRSADVNGDEYADNMRNYYEYVRENDLLTTHTLIPPQVNRGVSGPRQGGGQLSARIVDEDDDGVTIRGARMLATVAPLADELLVFPSTVLRGSPEDAAYSYAFAIPTDTRGLRFLCRRGLDGGGGHFNEPLASRFEELDAVVIFDDVHVPRERIFMLGNPELCNNFYADTDATTHMTHQVVARTTAKSEFFGALATEMAQAIGIDGFGHIQEDIAEILVAAELGRSTLRAAEADAQPNRFGVMTPRWSALNAARNWYPKISQRFPAILRKFGASGLMGLPGEADVYGSAAGDVETYLQGKNIAGPERVRLFRLAFDAALSAFGSRQALYEYYFFGDPLRMAGAFVASVDTTAEQERIRKFLEQG
ncbi:4-hydroxyphenylacetate 3-monooxygenase, oxygenase component [Spelaeicoccus albus]|uniref:4-hydroxyphenylacetate 3-monooxygenase n=1 Tax=Spelaeicoccus albus TaxID=1280376 RepID=A0A7Z0D1P9_9MICO|nr:4-hydroxyphenylacetate 3-monooxygenase, oxygenase component [Spelaeicoccus albus]NYI66520.1 4-hydroxyphenylacetate 3-monooxygenase [Spelaeicoccus albus]